MDSRTRTFLALERQPADRIPTDFWASGAMIRRIEAEEGLPYEAFLDRHDIDLRYIPGPCYVGPPLPEGGDIWGVRRRSVDVPTPYGEERYSEVAESPLAGLETPEEIAAYTGWPSADAFDYSVIPDQCRPLREAGRVVCFMGDRLNRVAQLKPAMYLRGAENIFVDLADRPEMAEAVFGKIREFYLDYLERILRAAAGKIDIVLTGDDFGAQNGLLVGAGMWRKFIMPGFADYIGLIKSHGAIAMHHTCGSVSEIIPDMIRCRLDVLQSIQPEARGMSLAGLKEKFGGSLCFHGGISIQKTMPFGSEDDVRREVRAIADVVRQDGGYIFCTSHNIQADTPARNIVALMEAYLLYGNTT